MKRSMGLIVLTLAIVLGICVAGSLVATSGAASAVPIATSGSLVTAADNGVLAAMEQESDSDCSQGAAARSIPPVPEPCCWCIYYVEWWEGEAEPSGDPNETNYYAAHTVEWLDAGHTEILPYAPEPPPIVIPDPTFHQYVDFYGGPGHPAGEWVECEPERYSVILLDVSVVALEFYNSRDTLLNWKTIYSVETPLGPVAFHEWEHSIDPIVGDPGWPWAVGEVWETTTGFCALPPTLRRHVVEGTETIVTDFFPGGIECYRVCTDRYVDTDGDGEPDSWEPSDCRWYHQDYGCPIRWHIYPWDIYTGWEYRNLIWYGPDPPFPPFEPPPTPTPTATPAPTPTPTPTSTPTPTFTPTPTPPPQCYIPMVAAGSFHTVALKSDGTAVAVGENSHGQCEVDTWTDIQQLAAGDYHTVGLKSDGSVVAAGCVYGAADFGQCDIGGWSDIQQVTTGSYHTVGLRSDGTVVAVGWNEYGQCDVGGWSGIQQVAACWWHTLGLRFDGTVVAVGWNDYGQCDVGGWSGIQQVAAGAYHTLVLKYDGTVVAVGHDNYGQCSDVDGWIGIEQVVAGFYHTVGLRSDGTVVAVGNNAVGQCEVGGWSDIQQVAAGLWHTVGSKSDGTVVAVGDNGAGQCDVGGWDLGQPLHYTLEVTSYGCCDEVEVDDVVYDLPYSDTFVCDTEVNLAAVESSVCQFDSWGGDASGSTSSIAITMDDDKSVVVYCSTVTQPPIGGTSLPTDKLGLMMPWIVAVGALIVVAGISLAIWNRRRGTERARGR